MILINDQHTNICVHNANIKTPLRVYVKVFSMNSTRQYKVTDTCAWFSSCIMKSTLTAQGDKILLWNYMNVCERQRLMKNWQGTNDILVFVLAVKKY